MPAKVVTSILAACLLVLGLSTASAPAQTPAETKVQTVDGEVVFAHGQRPGDPGNCSAIVFVKWADVPGTVKATAFYDYAGTERSKFSEPPFDDVYEWVATYTVPAGYHWIQIGKGWSDGPVVDTCEDTSEKQKTIIGTEARVELTIEIDQKACNTAKAKLAARRKAVNKLKKQLKNASTDQAKKPLRKKLKKAKAKRAKAAKRVAEAC